jgi:hypothetical protein
VDLISEAKHAFANRDIFWKGRLARNLEHKQQGLCVNWAVDCVEGLMALRCPVRKRELDADILAVRAAMVSLRRDSDQLIETARAVWLRPGRDGPQTAISRLFESIGVFQHRLNNEEPSSVTGPIMAISLMFIEPWPNGDEWHAHTEAMFEVCLKLHYDLILNPPPAWLTPSPLAPG